MKENLKIIYLLMIDIKIENGMLYVKNKSMICMKKLIHNVYAYLKEENI